MVRWNKSGTLLLRFHYIKDLSGNIHLFSRHFGLLRKQPPFCPVSLSVFTGIFQSAGQPWCYSFLIMTAKQFITKADVLAALETSLPIMITFIVLGSGYGILMANHGYGPLWALISGIVIFSGTAQFVSVGFLDSGSFGAAAAAALMVSARHIFFSISMIARYQKEGNRKWYLYYALCDETYAMLSRDLVPEGVSLSNYRLLVTLFNQASWLTGSFLGGLFGTMIEFNSAGIDFAMTALFATVFIQQWLDQKNRLPLLLGLFATLFCRMIFGSDLFLIPSMILILTVLTLMRHTLSEREETAG